MTLLEQLNALGYAQANRISAEKIMGWRLALVDPNEKLAIMEKPHHHGIEAWVSNVFERFPRNWVPCTDLNHTKLLIDRLSKEDLTHVLNLIPGILLEQDELNAYNNTVAIFNCPAEVRMAAILGALGLLTKG